MFTNVNINPISPASGLAGQLADKFPDSHKVRMRRSLHLTAS